MMKVAPARKEDYHKKKMETPSRINKYLQYCIGIPVYCFGLLPYKMDKETWEFSFRWISSETIWSLVRLVVFNSPFSFLPVILWGFYGPREWETEDFDFANMTSSLKSLEPTVSTIVFATEYVISYTYFIL